MRVDLLLDPFGGRWTDLRDAALAAEHAGFDGVWLYDHLAGSVHGRAHVLECWTTLTALAVAVPRISIGSLVLNVANRDPALLAVMAATLQEVSAGRLILGLGAGGSAATPYAAEQTARGRRVEGDRARRRAVEETVATLRAAWSGTLAGVSGFLRPEPPPPIIVGGFGPKMAELAGRVGDGLNAPAGPQLPELVQIARDAHAHCGRDPAAFTITASGSSAPTAQRPLVDLGVDRLIIFVAPPYGEGVARATAALTR